ncbi:MAG TPA: DUF3501 family protein [Acidimicrobiales bacterium]|nr:DUF3501 family protein [Acidimicrobiales bacterium]
MTSGPLALDDILDLRAYERVRDDYRRRIIELKRRRRVPLGPILTLVFECADTVRFQVQEMARAERIATDEGIQRELDVYNRLLPAEGELSATLFVELTTEADLRRWLPRLVGIEQALAVELGDPVDTVVASVPEEGHAEALTRETVTAAVHYLRFGFPAASVGRLVGADPAALTAHHPAYEARTELSDEVRATLAGDLEGTTELLALR